VQVTTEAPPSRRPLWEALAVGLAVTAVVTAVSAAVPDRYVATAVGFVFLGATWVMVWRHDDVAVKRAGLTLGGLVLPGRLPVAKAAASAAKALAWAIAFALVLFVPFYFGWKHWWHARGAFSLHMRPWELANQVFGQLVIIALPEEAFYRGYLQSRLDDAWPPAWRVAGALIGPGVFVASAIFAVGHFATIRDPARLAVFFPALVFGWLRARTGGVGASCTFHAMCNLFSEALGKGYGVY
jgi:hypothetical protein